MRRGVARGREGQGTRGPLADRALLGVPASALAVVMTGGLAAAMHGPPAAVVVLGLVGAMLVTLAWAAAPALAALPGLVAGAALPAVLVWAGVAVTGAVYVVGDVAGGVTPWAAVAWGAGTFLVAELGFDAATGPPRSGGELDSHRVGYLVAVGLGSIALAALAIGVVRSTQPTGIVVEVVGVAGGVGAIFVLLRLAERARRGAGAGPRPSSNRSGS